MAVRINENANVTLASAVKDASGAVQNLTGWTLTFIVKDLQANTTLITKSSAQAIQISVPMPANGIANVLILPADTSGLGGRTGLRYSLTAVDTLGNQFILDHDVFTVDPSFSL